MFQLRVDEIAFFITQNRHFRISEFNMDGCLPPICYDERQFARNWHSPRGMNV